MLLVVAFFHYVHRMYIEPRGMGVAITLPGLMIFFFLFICSCRSQMLKSRTQKRTVVRDGLGKHVHLERLDDTPDALQPDTLQQHLHQLLQRYCDEDQEEEEEEEEAGKED